MAPFSLPPINDNPDGSWGPSSSNMPSEYKFREIPYAPYSKSDKLGRFADWYDGAGDSRNPTMGPSTTQGTRSGATRGRKEGNQTFGSGTASAFAYFHVEDESSFSLVDSKATAIRRGGPITRGRAQGRGSSTYNRGGQRGGNTRGGFQQRGGGQRGGPRRGWRDWDKVPKLPFDPLCHD
jgi:translation initiation factor 3 subunit D